MERPERIMIVHPGPQFSVHDVFEGWMEAFCDAGIRTIDYNLQDRLAFYEHIYLWTGNKDEDDHLEFRKALDRPGVVGMASNGIMSTAYQFWPQVILVVSGFFIPPKTLDVLRDRGHKVVVLMTESPYEEDRQLEYAQHCDIALLNDPLRLKEYDAAGIPAFYMPHAYRPRRHNTGPGSDYLQTDFAFVGTGFPSRVEFFEKMIKAGAFGGLDVTIAGNWGMAPPESPVLPFVSHDLTECVDNEITTAVYRSARAGLNLYRREVRGDETFDGGVAMGPREVEMAACGLFYLRDPRPEGDELLPMLPTFAGPEDAAEQLKWWLAHDTERERAAHQARAAIRPRTFGANVEHLLGILDGL